MGKLTHAAFGSGDEVDEELFLPPAAPPSAAALPEAVATAPTAVPGRQDAGQMIVDRLFRIARASGSRVLPLIGPAGEVHETTSGMIDDLPSSVSGQGLAK